jgi:hypothetical protein
LSHTKLLKVAKDEDLTILCRQSLNGAADCPSDFNTRNRLVGRFVVRSEDVEIAR